MTPIRDYLKTTDSGRGGNPSAILTPVFCHPGRRSCAGHGVVASNVRAAVLRGGPPPLGFVHDCGHVLGLVAVRGADHGRIDGAAVALAVEVVQDDVLRPRQRLLLVPNGGNVQQRQLQVRRHRRGVLCKILRHLSRIVVAARSRNTIREAPLVSVLVKHMCAAGISLPLLPCWGPDDMLHMMATIPSASCCILARDRQCAVREGKGS